MEPTKKPTPVVQKRIRNKERNAGGPSSREVSLREKKEREEVRTVRVKGPVDLFLVVLVLVLLCIGTIIVFSASYPYAESKFNDATYFFQKQIVFALIGIAVLFAVSLIPYQVVRKLSYVAYLIALVPLVLVLFIGVDIGVTKRWILIPVVNQTFQPSELAKLGIILFLARYLDTREKKRKYVLEGVWERRLKDYLVPVLAIGVYLGLIMLEKHLSAIAIVASLGFLMLVFGSLKILPLLGIFGGCGIAGGAFYLLKNEYALSRITSFIEGKETMEMTDERFQTLHGLWAIGSGGALGLGLGASRLKNLWVSQAHNDFIFTIWCEETGFVGGAALIIVFGLLIWRGYLIALKAPDTYSTLTALGITTHIALQVVLNLGVVTDILPNTGISLPFISYGGTSLILIMMEMGILLSISKHTVETETVPEGETA